MDLTERMVESRTIFEGRIVKLTVDQARLACGEIQPLARSGAPAGEVAFLTAPMTEPQARDKLKGMAVGSLFRVLD